MIRDALTIIKMQKERLVEAGKSLAEKDRKIAELMRLRKVECTQQQLVGAVNEIIRSFEVDEDEISCSRFEYQIRVLGDFMRIAGMKGHIAINCKGNDLEIVLD
jgi:hypothetical protein